MVLLSALGGTILSHARGSARTSQRAFVSWARQAAIPVPASPEEPMSDEARSALGRMLEGKQQLLQVEAIQKDLSERRDVFTRSLGKDHWRQLDSWVRTLRAGIAAVDRPRAARDPSRHRLWRAERERTMMEQMDDTTFGIVLHENVKKEPHSEIHNERHFMVNIAEIFFLQSL